MKSDYLTLGLSALAGGLAYDKLANDGKITDKVVGAVGGGGFVETIKETVSGGTDVIRETITKEVFNNVGEGFGNFADNVKEGVGGAVNNVKSNLPSTDLNFPSLNSDGGGFLSGYSNFKENGGLIGEGSDIVGFGWLSDNVKGFFGGAVDVSQDFYSGAYNIGTLVNSAVTGKEYETKVVNGNALRYPKDTSSGSSGGFKSSSSSRSSSSGSSSRNSSSGSSNEVKNKAKVIIGDKFQGPVRPKDDLKGFRSSGRTQKKPLFKTSRSSIFGGLL